MFVEVCWGSSLRASANNAVLFVLVADSAAVCNVNSMLALPGKQASKQTSQRAFAARVISESATRFSGAVMGTINTTWVS